MIGLFECFRSCLLKLQNFLTSQRDAFQKTFAMQSARHFAGRRLSASINELLFKTKPWHLPPSAVRSYRASFDIVKHL